MLVKTQSLSLHNCESLLTKVPFLRDADESFIQAIVTVLTPIHFLADDVIFEAGTSGEEMFFMYIGTVDVIIDEVPRAKLHSGSFFGGMEKASPLSFTL